MAGVPIAALRRARTALTATKPPAHRIGGPPARGDTPVPHRTEAFAQLSPGEDDFRLTVTAVPDAKKGERLIVFHTGLTKPAEEVCRLLGESGLPPLWIPAPGSLVRVEEIPVLGTGKLGVRAVKNLAAAKFAPSESEPASG